MNKLEKLAYEIGINEAKENHSNVPACRSEKMNALMKEVKNGLLPLIKAYNRGVSEEMSRQAWEVLKR